MKAFSLAIATFAITFLAFMFFIRGLDNIAANQCLSRGENAEVETAYIENECHVKLNGEFVREKDLIYYVNQMEPRKY